MNILYIMRYWPVYGGGETITATLSNEFVKRGHKVFIAYTHWNSIDPMPYQVDERVTCDELNTIENYKNSDVQHLHDYIVANNIDVMINQWGSTDLCDQARKNTKCKLITCWHVNVLLPLGEPTSWKRRLLQPILGKKYFERRWRRYQMNNHLNNYKKSDKYVFLATSFENEYRALSHIEDSQQKLYSINNPLTYHFKYDISQYDTKKKEVLYVGRIFEYPKRVSYILRIWKKIEDDATFSEWNLKIVGDGPDLDQMRELAIKLDLKRVKFEGFQNPRSYYNEASIFMMTSASEGFGMTLVEAQQYGVVPMAMDTYSSLHEIIQDGYNGVIIEDNDLDGYAQSLKKFMRDQALRKKLAINGLESCKKFSADHIVDEWERLFEELKK